MKISITIETERLEEFHRLADPEAGFSAVIGDVVRREAKRLQMIAILDEMERENPISDEDRKRGEASWHRFERAKPARERSRKQ
jgi:hypothetical protein